MFGRKSNNSANSAVTIDDCIYFKRNGTTYRQLSFWENGARYSTLIANDVHVPEVGTVVPRSTLDSWKISV